MPQSKKISEFTYFDTVTDADIIPLLTDGPDNAISTADAIRRNRALQCRYTNIGYPDFESVQNALDYLLYVAPTVALSVTAPSPTTRLLGSTVTSVTLNWSVTALGPLTTQSINQGIGSITPALRAYTQSSLSMTTDTTYTITINDGTSSASSSASVIFRNLYYVGTPSAIPTSSADVRAISAGTYSNARQTSFTSNPAGNYICFAYPSRFGAATINVNGLLNTAFTLQTIEVTNAASFAEDYYVYTSNTIQNGLSILMQVL